MAKIVEKKMIFIPSNGPIMARSGIIGPITTPYIEDVKTIFRILSEGKKVVEVLNDGIQVNLTVSNFNTDNTPVVEAVKVVEPPKAQVPPTNNQQQNQKNQQQQYQKNQQQQQKQQPPVEEPKKETTTADELETK